MAQVIVHDIFELTELSDHAKEVYSVLDEVASRSRSWFDETKQCLSSPSGVVMFVAVGGGLTVLQNFEQDLLDTSLSIYPVVVGGSGPLITKAQNDMSCDSFAERLLNVHGVRAVLAATCSGKTALVKSFVDKAGQLGIPAIVVTGRLSTLSGSTTLRLSTIKNDVFEDCLAQILHVMVSSLKGVEGGKHTS